VPADAVEGVAVVARADHVGAQAGGFLFESLQFDEEFVVAGFQGDGLLELAVAVAGASFFRHYQLAV